jgi:chromosome segregation ATPase
LQAVAGELVATLWAKSTTSAQAALEALRTDAEAEKASARNEVASLQAELVRTETALEQRTGALLAAQVRVQELEQTQAAGEATRQALETEIARQQDEIGARNRALEQARTDFSGELEKLRASTDLEQARLQAAEKRALLEIERERSASARLHKDLDSATRRAELARPGIVRKSSRCRFDLVTRVIEQVSWREAWRPFAIQTRRSPRNSTLCVCNSRPPQ